MILALTAAHAVWERAMDIHMMLRFKKVVESRPSRGLTLVVVDAVWAVSITCYYWTPTWHLLLRRGL